jgi:hypothetical protein
MYAEWTLLHGQGERSPRHSPHGERLNIPSFLTVGAMSLSAMSKQLEKRVEKI